MSEIEDEAASLLGKTLIAWGYQDGCVVITLDDGREVVMGAEHNRIWWRVDEPTLQ